MKTKLLILFTLITKVCVSQQILPVQHDTTLYSHEVIVSGIGEYSSTSLRNEMTKMLFFGGTITNQIKDHSFSSHKAINRFGLDLNAELEYRNMAVNLFKQSTIGFVVKGGYYSLGSIAYSKDAFGIGFYGNSAYLGQTASFSGSNAYFIDFQKVGFGLIDKISKSSITLNVYNVSNYYRGYLKTGELEQDTNGTSISLDLNGAVSGTQGNSFSKGLGLGIDFDYRVPMLWGENKRVTIQFLAKNVGIVNYYTGIQRYEVDSVYNYDGFKLSQVYGDQSIFSDNYSLFDTLQIEKSIQRKTLMLPGFLQVGKIVDENYTGKIQSFFGVRLYPSLAFSPQAYAGANYSVCKWLDIGTQGTFGGFSDFRVGFYSTFKLKSWTVGIATQDLYGVISKNGFGQSILFRIRCRI